MGEVYNGNKSVTALIITIYNCKVCISDLHWEVSVLTFKSYFQSPKSAKEHSPHHLDKKNIPLPQGQENKVLL